MSQTSLVPMDLDRAIGKLLSSDQLRNDYAKSPFDVAKQLNVAEQNVRYFVALNPCRLNTQAETALNKRWHEIQRLLPETVAALGQQAFRVFRQFAKADWPVGHRRHPVDAFRFLQFLQSKQIVSPASVEFRRLKRLAS